MKINCPVKLSGPSALHTALFEDGGLNEHIAQCHPEEGQAMTNSTKRRQNSGARYVAYLFWLYALDAEYRGGAFDVPTVQRMTGEMSRDARYEFDRECLDEVNWPYAAELLNWMVA